jgi:hypothetical protein
MKNRLLILCLIGFVTTVNSAMASNDSIYFYKSGQIIYKRATTEIDSVTFVPIDYYEVKQNEAIFGVIQSYPELSLFSSMLRVAGYAGNVAEKTIWAPTNASLSRVDMSDTIAVRRLVENHLSHNQWSFGDSLTNPYIQMINSKKYAINVGNKRINGTSAVIASFSAFNSKIHLLDAPIPVRNNVWEYLSQDSVGDGADVFRSYVREMNRTTSNGKVKNDVLAYLGDLDNEDEWFVAIVPSDSACSKAYQNVSPLLSTPVDRGGITQQENDTKWIILREQFIRCAADSVKWQDNGYTINQPDTMNTTFWGSYVEKDLLTTTDSIIHLSNGLILCVNSIPRFDSTKLKETTVYEAENALKIKKANSKQVIEVGKGNLPVSGGAYLKNMPDGLALTSTIVVAYVALFVPDLYVRPYNVYAVIVPTCYEDSADNRPNKITTVFGVEKPSGLMSGRVTNNNMVTNGTDTTKLLVAEKYQMPYIEVVRNPALGPMEHVRIQNAAKISEVGTYDRTIRIDCLIFEPVD